MAIRTQSQPSSFLPAYFLSCLETDVAKQLHPPDPSRWPKIGIETRDLSFCLLLCWSARGKSEFLPPTDTHQEPSTGSAEMLTSGWLASDCERGRHWALHSSSSHSTPAVIT